MERLVANGLKIEVRDVDNNAARKRLGMPEQLGSCHTGSVGGYAIKGHVPAADTHRLLKERPLALGLSVPGMPIGKTGMNGLEYKVRKDANNVLPVQKTAATKIFQHHPGMRRMARQDSLHRVSDKPNALPWDQRIDTLNHQTVRAPRSKHHDSTCLKNRWMHHG